MSVATTPLFTKPDSKDDVTVRLLTAFKSLISEGILIPGSYLPAERELADHFQVSRSSLRQALKVLQIMGVISQKVGHGTCINPEATSVLGEPMEFLLLLNGISSHELMEARVIVEPELAARAAVRAGEEDLAALRREITEMRAPNVNGSQARHDMLFHQAIFHAAGNRLCSMMFKVIHESLRNLIDTTSRMVPVEHTVRFHQRIYAAIRRRDPDEARKQMTEHLIDARSLLVRATDEQQYSRLENRIKGMALPPAPGSGRRSKVTVLPPAAERPQKPKPAKS